MASMETADTAEGLRIESVTGVELNLAIAGLGGRSLAFTSDFLIRAVAALAWYFAAMFMLEKVFDTQPSEAAYGYWVGLPSAAIYLSLSPGHRSADGRSHAGQAHGGHSHRDA